jgi:hypothetical protein
MNMRERIIAAIIVAAVAVSGGVLIHWYNSAKREANLKAAEAADVQYQNLMLINAQVLCGSDPLCGKLLGKYYLARHACIEKLSEGSKAYKNCFRDAEVDYRREMGRLGKYPIGIIMGDF